MSSFTRETAYRWVTEEKKKRTPFRERFTNYPINDVYDPNFFTQTIRNTYKKKSAVFNKHLSNDFTLWTKKKYL